MTDPSAEDRTGRPESAAEPSGQAAEGDDTSANAVDQADDAGDKRDGGRYRRRLREATEATAAAMTERDQLRDRLELHQRAEVTRLAGEQQLAQPAAIWATGATVADFLDADGQVDPVKVKDAAVAAVAQLGLAKRPRPPRRDQAQGARPNDRDTGENAWAELLHRK